MHFSVGDLIHNATTYEECRIVRIAAIAMNSGYVVACGSSASGKEIETLWRLREVTEVREIVGLGLKRALQKKRNGQDEPKPSLKFT